MHHKSLANGRWFELTLVEQMGNIGSEVSRAIKAQERHKEDRKEKALERALELIDLTIQDPKNSTRLKEVCRTREVLCDYFYCDNIYKSTGESLNKYFLPYGEVANRK